ncbi:exodeoxyribonuclease VII large subunit [Roseiarcus fermentans]|uniref:Exodeoxyribonuclease 7 large subunit n=1 Tax=Roseiarcus fermentans TaxID=1473586 RepID=A0A366EKZ9_9HYPH|nr:exodeoxyribonuclease VII large subunit [Roseiarcus fermentans]RBP03063.1 exodeoxyribonuclease VII large subunit [Roseiarcus fermentans]
MAAPETTASNAPEISVSELSNSIKRAIEDRFGYVRVRGEISGYRGPHSSGHAYFSLKDAGARLDAVVWRTAFVRMKVKPEEGLEVVAVGRLTTFPGKSSYQIVVEQLEPAGVGALMALLEARRKKLADEGLFDAARKRKVPFLPRVVGVVTSPTGAVIRDILHRLADRFPVRVVVWPVRVQGDTSAAEVAAAIDGFNALGPNGPAPRPDVLIVARGGGSLEDLMGFNEEAAVRAVARSAIPVIAAVGHETDWTLIDHAADLRAPTPTAAAEFAVPVRSDLLASVAELDARRRGAARRLGERRRADLRALSRALPGGEALVAGPRQRLDRAGAALAARLRGAVDARALKLAGLARGLARHSPRAHLAGLTERVRGVAGRLRRLGPALIERPRREAEAAARGLVRERSHLARRRAERAGDLQNLGARLGRAFADALAARRARVAASWQLAGAVSYRAVLARGFALVRDEAGEALRSAAETREGQRLRIEFADGSIPAIAGAGSGDAASRPVLAAPPRPKRARGGAGEGQGSLF